MADRNTFPLNLQELLLLDRPGLMPEKNPSLQAAVPDELAALQSLVKNYLKNNPLGPRTTISEHKVLNYIFEKVARQVFDGDAVLSEEGVFRRGVEKVIRRGQDNIGPAGYECSVELVEELLDFLKFQKVLYDELDNRPDIEQILAFKKEYIEFVLDHIPKRRGLRIMDLGCGYGTVAYHLAGPECEVIGVDYSFSRVEKIAPLFDEMSLEGKVDICWDDATDLSFPDGHFDQVVSADLIEHMGPGEQLQSLAEVRRVLRPGGEWFIATPNLTYLRITTLARKVAALFRGGSVLERVRRFCKEEIPYTSKATVGHGQHIGLLRAKELFRLAEKAGLRPTDIFFYMRSDVPARLPGIARYLVKFSPFKGWLSSWFLIRGERS